MKSLRNITFAALLLFLGSNMQAQTETKGQHHGHKGGQIEQMKESLNLTDAQSKQMTAIQEKYRAQIHVTMADTQVDEATKQDKVHALRKAKRAEMDAILTAEQRAKAATLRQEGHHGSQGMGHHGGQEMGKGHGQHAGVQKQLEPLIIAQRQKLEPQISADDKAALSILRSKLAVLDQEMKAAHQTMRNMKESGTPPTEAQRAQMKAIHEQHKNMMDEAAVIAQHYAPQIEALHAEIQPQMDAIMQEAAAKRAAKMETKGTEKPGCTKGDGKCEGKGQGQCKGQGSGEGHKHGEGHGPEGRGGHGSQGGFHGSRPALSPEMHKEIMMARFVLIDPNNAGSMSKKDAKTIAKGVQVFPNPATTSNTLRIELATAGQVVVELMTIDGKILRVVENGNHPAGTLSIDVNTSDLSAGTYIYRIVDASGSHTQKFSVQK